MNNQRFDRKPKPEPVKPLDPIEKFREDQEREKPIDFSGYEEVEEEALEKREKQGE